LTGGRRRGLAVAAAAALVALACSDPPTANSAGDQAATGPDGLPECPIDALDGASGPITIDLWYGGLAGAAKTTMDDMVARFNQSQGDVVINASDQGTAYEEVYRAFESAASAAGGKQLPDIVYLEDTQLASLADSGLVLPAQACMDAAGYDPTDLEAAARAKYSIGGVLYPGYMNVSTPVLYFNKAHFVKAGLDPAHPPQTLEEVSQAAEKIKAAGIAPKPFAMKTDRWYFDTWLGGIGDDIVNNGNGRNGEATRATFATPEATKLLEFLKKMDDEGLLNAFANTEGAIDDYLALVTEQSSMVIETSTAATTVRDALNGQITAAQAGVDFDASVVDSSRLVPGTGPFPGIDAGGQVFASGGAFYMLNSSKPAEQAAAWRFMDFMLQPENAAVWHTSGSYLPVVKAVTDLPQVQAFWRDDLAGVLLQPGVEQFAHADPDLPGPLIGPYSDEATAVQGAMDGVLFTGQKPEAALDDAQTTVTAALERYAG
jgi:sn-glycerol 3-phosphate transport system substrate-binding protein